MPKPLYIFDLDGTLALIDHRRPILDGSGKDKWARFYAACVDDAPNRPVLDTMLALRSAGADVWVWSGRSDEVRRETAAWLATFGPPVDLRFDTRLQMRRAGDFTADDLLKRQWLDAMRPEDRARLVAVFDDRDKVVAMWRAAGVACFQVAPGGF